MPLLVGGDSLIPGDGFKNFHYPPELVNQTFLLNKLPLHNSIACHDWKKYSLYNVIPNCHPQWQSILPITRLQQLTLGNKATDLPEKQPYAPVIVGNPNSKVVNAQQPQNKNSVCTRRKESNDIHQVEKNEKSFQCKSVIKCNKLKTSDIPNDKIDFQDVPKEVQYDKDAGKYLNDPVESNLLSTRKRSSSWPGDTHLKVKLSKKSDDEKHDQIYKNLEMDVANILVSDIPFAVIGLHHGKDMKEFEKSKQNTAHVFENLCPSDQENNHDKGNATKVLFTCQQCAISCNSTEELLSHNSKHNTSNNFLLTCNVCSQVFRSTSGLQKHVEFHGDDNHRHSCSFCFQPFQSKDKLEEHIVNMHMSKRPHKCTYCPKAFRDPGSLQKHIRVHTGEKPYHCTSCEKSFAEYSSLRKHLRVHTGEQPYKCKFCTKAFSISGNLQRHILIHTGERPYKCSNCNKAFNNPSHLRRHVKNLHSKLETEK